MIKIPDCELRIHSYVFRHFFAYSVVPNCPRTVVVHSPVYPGGTLSHVHTVDHLHASIAHAALLVISSRICLRFLAFLHTFSLYSSGFFYNFLPVTAVLYACKKRPFAA
jgi:hypothetical protein